MRKGGSGGGRGRGRKSSARGRSQSQGGSAKKGSSQKRWSSRRGESVRNALQIAAEAKASTAEEKERYRTLGRRQRAKRSKAEQRSKLRREQKAQLLDDVIDVLREDFSRADFDNKVAVDDFAVSALAESCGRASFEASRTGKEKARESTSRPLCHYFQLGKW